MYSLESVLSLCLGRHDIFVGSMNTVPQNHNLVEDVIPELDENNLTTTSIKNDTMKPRMSEIFNQSTPPSSRRIPLCQNMEIPGPSVGRNEVPLSFTSAPPTMSHLTIEHIQNNYKETTENEPLLKNNEIDEREIQDERVLSCDE